MPLRVTRPTAQWLQVELPAFIPRQAITAPAGTATVQLLVKAAAYNLHSLVGGCSEMVLLSIPYSNELQPAQLIDLCIDTAAGGLVLTVMRMRFLDASGVEDQRPAFMPSAVIDARYC